MSEGMRIAREMALNLAEGIQEQLILACSRVEIAGSLRRGRPDVGDIELVCIPWAEPDLFGEIYYPPYGINQIMEKYYGMMNRIKGGDHYQQWALGICNVDLFITTPEQWGVIFMIRTGSAEFTRRMVTPRSHGGFMPSNLQVKDGRLWRGSVALDTPEETDIFKYYGMQFIPPEKRNDDNGTRNR